MSENTATPSEPEEVEPAACTHVCSEESGCITEVLDCKHEHDEACGYVPATEGTPCTFVCEICNAHDSGDTATPSDAQPEECTCEKLCTEEEINEDCPVCGAGGANLSACEGLEAQPATPSNALPVTALTAGEIELYIGGQQITESGCYENQNDTWTKVDGTEPASGQFYYDASTATLKLNNVSIEGGSGMEDTLSLQTTDSDASLKIVLKGENYLTGGVPIQVYAENNNASLTITGEGTLTTTGTGSGGAGGIFVQSGPMESTNGSYLTIEGGANVISNCTQTTAVTLVAPAAGEAILTVQGGNLTADGGSSAGIYYDKLDGNVPSDDRRYLRIANNSVVRTNRLAHATGLSVQIQYSASSGGIYMSNGDGIVYGPMKLQEHFEIGEGESLNIPSGASLTIGSGATLTNEGTVTTTDGGTLINNGKIENSGTLPSDIKGNPPPTITTTSLDGGTVGTAYSATFAANNATSWSLVTGSTLPDGLTLAESTGVISGTPTADGTFNFTVKAANGGGSDSKELSITIGEQTNVPVNRVLLNKTSTTLTVGNTETLTATVEPANATNKAVTWSSDNESVATVDANGLVTAVGAGTANIKVETEDGKFTDTCTVTVNPVQYTVTVQTDGNGSASASPASAPAGTAVTLTADPDSGYRFKGWEVVSGGVTISGNQFTMPAGNVTVKAVFVRNSSGFVPTRPWKPSRPVEPEEPEEPETPVLNGWVQEDGVWYLYKDGSMATGWNLYNGTWYYLHDWGGMATGWINLGGAWYYLYDWGGMATGWINLGGAWYYLYDWGGMATGWLNLNGTWYYLYDWGGMATGWLNLNGTWYYLRDWGGMATGWQLINGRWYYFYPGGSMAANTYVNGYYLSGSGAWAE